MPKRDIIPQEELDQEIADITNGITLPGVIQALANLVADWLTAARQYKQPLNVQKWEAVQHHLLEAYRASVRRYDGLG